MNILYLIFLFFFFWSLGDILSSGLRIRENGYFLRTALGLIATSYITLFLASYGLLDRNLVFTLVIIVILIRIRKLSQLLILTGRKSIGFINNLGIYEKILFIILSLQIGINFFIALTPVTGWDSLAYHLTIPKLIIQGGRMIHYADYGGAGYPLFVEMIFTLGLLLRDPGLVKLMCWGISVLAVAAIYILAIRIGLKPVAVIGSLIFYSTQVVSIWAGECYIDIAFAFFVTLAAIILIEFLQRKDSSLILVWLSISILPGIKYSGLILSFIIGLYLIYQILIQKKNIKAVVKAICLGLLIISALNSPWYFIPKERQAHTDSTILYPGDSSVLRHPSIVKGYLKRWVFFLRELTLKWDKDGRIGPLFLSFLPLLILARPLKKEIQLLLIISLSYAAIFLFFGNLFPRYAVPIMPLLGIVVAWAFMRLIENDKLLSCFLRVCLIFAFTFNLGLTLYNHRLELAYLSGKISKDKFFNAKVRCHSAINYINQNIHQGTILLIGETRVYYLEKPFLLEGSLSGREVAEICDILRQKNITCIMVNERVVYKVKKNIAMQELLKYLNQNLELLYHQGHFKVYKLAI